MDKLIKVIRKDKQTKAVFGAIGNVVEFVNGVAEVNEADAKYFARIPAVYTLEVTATEVEAVVEAPELKEEIIAPVVEETPAEVIETPVAQEEPATTELDDVVEDLKATKPKTTGKAKNTGKK